MLQPSALEHAGDSCIHHGTLNPLLQPQLVTGCVATMCRVDCHCSATHIRTGVEDVVDIFQEALLQDLCVAEEENHRLVVHACRPVKLDKVSPELCCPIHPAQLNLEDVAAADVCSQTCQALLATAANAHKHGIAAGLHA